MLLVYCIPMIDMDFFIDRQQYLKCHRAINICANAYGKIEEVIS